MTNSPIPGDVVARLRRVIARAEDNAGMLPAKDAVKLRPYDWHAVTDQGRQAADLIEALHFDVGKYKSRLETVFAEKEALQHELAEALEEAAKVADLEAERRTVDRLNSVMPSSLAVATGGFSAAERIAAAIRDIKGAGDA